MIVRLVARPRGGVDVAMYRALHEDLSLDEALDLDEIDKVSQSWRVAAELNARIPKNG